MRLKNNNKPKSAMYKNFNWSACAIMCFMFCWLACRTTKQTPEEKAYEERATRIKLLADARKMFPCDTIHTETVKIDTAFLWMTRQDTVHVSDNGDSIYYIDRYHTVEKVITKTNTVIDQAALQMARDSIDNRGFLLDAAIKANSICEQDKTALKAQISTLNTYKGVIIGMSILLAVLGMYIAYRAIKNTYS